MVAQAGQLQGALQQETQGLEHRRLDEAVCLTKQWYACLPLTPVQVRT